MKPGIPETRPDDIDQEVKTFESHYGQIVKNVGKYVLIHGNRIIDYFNSYREAILEGYKRFRLDNFLVRQIKHPETSMSMLRCGVKRINNDRLRLARTKS